MLIEACKPARLQLTYQQATGQRRPGADKRVNRGGSWNNNADNCTVANRNRNSPDNRNNNLGLRLSSSPHPSPDDAPLAWAARPRAVRDHLTSRPRRLLGARPKLPHPPPLVGPHRREGRAGVIYLVWRRL